MYSMVTVIPAWYSMVQRWFAYVGQGCRFSMEMYTDTRCPVWAANALLMKGTKNIVV